MKNIQIAAGCKTRIIQRRFSSLVTTYTFDAVTVHARDVEGIVEVQGSDWIVPKASQRIPLQSRNIGLWTKR